MPDTKHELSRADVDYLRGPVLVEFGARWCGHCRVIKPDLALLLRQHPDVQHLQVEDGPGQALGRSFGVKLWPTLVFMLDGKVLRQLSRPSVNEVRDAFALWAEQPRV